VIPLQELEQKGGSAYQSEIIPDPLQILADALLQLISAGKLFGKLSS
jgi:hypothetical protein